MPAAARVLDPTNHGGLITGPGASMTFIEGKPAAVAGDMHVCALPPNGHQPTNSPFPQGSATVFIEGRPALRTTDVCGCGAMPSVGAVLVNIN